MIENYLDSIKRQFEYYKTLGERTFDQLDEESLFISPEEHSNSVAVIVNHISGNMKSRWTDFLNSDGEKEWRKRDEEFEDIIQTKTELLQRWNEGWTCLFTALNSINPGNFNTIIYIRNQGHTITEAINRQLAHYAYHIGQIVYMGKWLISENWKSLSIPKGNSVAYNAEKFAKEKRVQHFTDEFLDQKGKLKV